MSSDSLQVAGMAERGQLPFFLAKRSKYGTPTYGILLSATGVICLGWLSFTDIIQMLNILYCIAELIEFSAFLYLRKYRSDIHRPYKIPLGFRGCCVMLFFPSLLILVVMFTSSLIIIILSLTLSLSGIALYYALEWAKKTNRWEFRNVFEEEEMRGGDNEDDTFNISDETPLVNHQNGQSNEKEDQWGPLSPSPTRSISQDSSKPNYGGTEVL